MSDVSKSFAVLLSEAPLSECDRRVWRDRLHGDGTQHVAAGPVRQILFRGSSSSGSELVLLPAANGALEAVLDGVLVAVLDRADELERSEPGFVFALDGAGFHETSAVPGSMLGELREALVTGRTPRPGDVRELIADGLIDRTLNLTPRGRRVLALDRSPARHEERATSPSISLRGPVPERAREMLARTLVRLSLDAPRPVLRITASLCRQEDPALLRPVVAKARLDVNGRSVRAGASAPTENEAIRLLESRLHRRLRALAEREIAARRGGRLRGPAPSSEL